MMCKLKGQMDKGHYYVQIKRVHEKGGIMMCILKGWMDMGEDYKIEIKGWMEKVAL